MEGGGGGTVDEPVGTHLRSCEDYYTYLADAVVVDAEDFEARDVDQVTLTDLRDLVFVEIEPDEARQAGPVGETPLGRCGWWRHSDMLCVSE